MTTRWIARFTPSSVERAHRFALPKLMARRRPIVRHLVIYLALAPFLVIALFPVVWMAITAFKHERDLYTMGISFWFYESPTLKHFRLLFTQTWFGRWMVTPRRCRGPWSRSPSRPLSGGLRARPLPPPGGGQDRDRDVHDLPRPPVVLFVPLTYAVAKLGILDSSWALVLVYPTLTIPFWTWLMFGFLRGVPAEIEEAAGSTAAGSAGLVRIVLPMSLPAIVTIAIFAFTLSMQEYLYAVCLAAAGREGRHVGLRRCSSAGTSSSGVR